MDFEEKCPLCGTQGREWDKADQINKSDEILQCPNCSSVYSKFGILVESQKDVHEFWS